MSRNSPYGWRLRLVREIAQDFKTDLRFQSAAIGALQPQQGCTECETPALSREVSPRERWPSISSCPDEPHPSLGPSLGPWFRFPRIRCSDPQVASLRCDQPSPGRTRARCPRSYSGPRIWDPGPSAWPPGGPRTAARKVPPILPSAGLHAAPGYFQAPTTPPGPGPAPALATPHQLCGMREEQPRIPPARVAGPPGRPSPSPAPRDRRPRPGPRRPGRGRRGWGGRPRSRSGAYIRSVFHHPARGPRGQCRPSCRRSEPGARPPKPRERETKKADAGWGKRGGPGTAGPTWGGREGPRGCDESGGGGEGPRAPSCGRSAGGGAGTAARGAPSRKEGPRSRAAGDGEAQSPDEVRTPVPTLMQPHDGRALQQKLDLSKLACPSQPPGELIASSNLQKWKMELREANTAQGNQRELAHQKNMKKSQEISKRKGKEEILTTSQRKQRDSEIMQQKQKAANEKKSMQTREK
uniref:collagen alpha-1(I) chain-like n=1 Tax=Odobenus rosmarus divergens TaxID=9708 RepID=UPI00063CA09C|nr:PREDICTED: collagen alpha-1(I) chain-like [Odobenus rosmarus divergens]